MASVTAMLGNAGFVALALDIFHVLPGSATWEDANRVSPDSVRVPIDRGVLPTLRGSASSAFCATHAGQPATTRATAPAAPSEGAPAGPRHVHRHG